MKKIVTAILFLLVSGTQRSFALNGTDVSIRCISGYFWMDNSCTVAGPQGKVVSFRIVNTKGTNLYGVSLRFDSIVFTAAPSISYSSGTPSFNLQTTSNYYIGYIAAGDSATAFFYVGYNCLIYPNNTNLTTDYITTYVTASDNLAGTVSTSAANLNYVLRNANNNTITILATSTNTVGTLATISVAYSISNVKPGNIIDMELSTLPAFPAGYEIVGCEITSSTITGDFPTGMKNTHYKASVTTNLPNGGTVTILWTLRITGTSTGLNSSNLTPFVVSDAGSAQRWQANTTSFTGTSVPVNPISISKRVNVQDVLIGDTVEYTIVIHNSSTTADVMLDRILDHLPRDYKFRYMESDTITFGSLVTPHNSSLIPEFEDTGYLDFRGRMPLGGGLFSWVVPSQDSIKLIYSVEVSGNPGLRDTNFVSPYVGDTPLDTAHAIVNVYSILSVRLSGFRAQRSGSEVLVTWSLASPSPGSGFVLSRRTAYSDTYYPVLDIKADDIQTLYTFREQPAAEWGQEGMVYRLEIKTPEGNYYSYEYELGPENSVNPFVVARNGNNFEILTVSTGSADQHLQLFDNCGRLLYTDFKQGGSSKPLSFNKNQTGNTSGIVFAMIQVQDKIYTLLIPVD